MGEVVVIQRAILHILDGNLGIPVLSDGVLEISEILDEYITKHINRVFRDEDIKEINGNESKNNLIDSVHIFNNDSSKFVDLSKEFGKVFFDAINKYDIPSADLLIVDLLFDSKSYLAIFKMNYKKSYIHHVNNQNEVSNSIVCQPVSLPNDSQKIDEFIIFSLKDNRIILKEKKYEIDGKKENYISKYILNVRETKSSKEKLNIINNAAEKVINKYHPDDIETNINVNESICNGFNENRHIDIEDVANRLSKGVDSAKSEFISEIRSHGITEKELKINDNLQKRINQKQKIVTGDGIELKMPMEYFNRKDKIEIVNNIDGTISITIKNVELMK